MSEQQQRMAAVETDKELSDLLDFSAVSQWEISLGSSGWHWCCRWGALGEKNAIQVWLCAVESWSQSAGGGPQEHSQSSVCRTTHLFYQHSMFVQQRSAHCVMYTIRTAPFNFTWM